MKIRPVGVELFHADGQTDKHDEAIVAFHNFANAPKKSCNIRNTFSLNLITAIPSSYQLAHMSLTAETKNRFHGGKTSHDMKLQAYCIT